MRPVKISVSLLNEGDTLQSGQRGVPAGRIFMLRTMNSMEREIKATEGGIESMATLKKAKMVWILIP
jgi:hypothetical protein